MGCYVNTSDMSKEEWLRQNCINSAPKPFGWDEIPEDCMLVVLMDNGAFTAAGVAYSQSEYTEFTRNDGRSKWYYIVPIHLLRNVSPLDVYVKQQGYSEVVQERMLDRLRNGAGAVMTEVSRDVESCVNYVVDAIDSMDLGGDSGDGGCDCGGGDCGGD